MQPLGGCADSPSWPGHYAPLVRNAPVIDRLRARHLDTAKHMTEVVGSRGQAMKVENVSTQVTKKLLNQ